jgi:hypothetical protein
MQVVAFSSFRLLSFRAEADETKKHLHSDHDRPSRNDNREDDSKHDLVVSKVVAHVGFDQDGR